MMQKREKKTNNKKKPVLHFAEPSIGVGDRTPGAFLDQQNGKAINWSEPQSVTRRHQRDISRKSKIPTLECC